MKYKVGYFKGKNPTNFCPFSGLRGQAVGYHLIASDVSDKGRVLWSFHLHGIDMKYMMAKISLQKIIQLNGEIFVAANLVKIYLGIAKCTKASFAISLRY